MFKYQIADSTCAWRACCATRVCVAFRPYAHSLALLWYLLASAMLSACVCRSFARTLSAACTDSVGWTNVVRDRWRWRAEPASLWPVGHGFRCQFGVFLLSLMKWTILEIYTACAALNITLSVLCSLTSFNFALLLSFSIFEFSRSWELSMPVVDFCLRRVRRSWGQKTRGGVRACDSPMHSTSVCVYVVYVCVCDNQESDWIVYVSRSSSIFIVIVRIGLCVPNRTKINIHFNSGDADGKRVWCVCCQCIVFVVKHPSAPVLMFFFLFLFILSFKSAPRTGFFIL